MDALAHEGNPDAIPFPSAQVKDCPYDFSFSGMKTAAINHLHTASQKGEEVCKEDVAASFTKSVCGAICLRLEKLFDSPEFTSGKLVVGGGVAANSHIRASIEKLCKKKNVEFYCIPKALCGDNAVMIGAQGYYEYINGTADFFNYALNAYATSDVGDSE
jgi:N6-L-threonylcarbamoyladenine synthase